MTKSGSRRGGTWIFQSDFVRCELRKTVTPLEKKISKGTPGSASDFIRVPPALLLRQSCSTGRMRSTAAQILRTSRQAPATSTAPSSSGHTCGRADGSADGRGAVRAAMQQAAAALHRRARLLFRTRGASGRSLSARVAGPGWRAGGAGGGRARPSGRGGAALAALAAEGAKSGAGRAEPREGRRQPRAAGRQAPGGEGQQRGGAQRCRCLLSSARDPPPASHQLAQHNLHRRPPPTDFLIFGLRVLLGGFLMLLSRE